VLLFQEIMLPPLVPPRFFRPKCLFFLSSDPFCSYLFDIGMIYAFCFLPFILFDCSNPPFTLSSSFFFRFPSCGILVSFFFLPFFPIFLVLRRLAISSLFFPFCPTFILPLFRVSQHYLRASVLSSPKFFPVFCFFFGSVVAMGSLAGSFPFFPFLLFLLPVSSPFLLLMRVSAPFSDPPKLPVPVGQNGWLSHPLFFFAETRPCLFFPLSCHERTHFFAYS